MKIRNLVITIISIGIIGCGSSGDSAVSTANTNPQPIEDKIIFRENFDDTPDWTSDDKKLSNFGIVEAPKGWTSAFSIGDRYSPLNGDPNNHPTVEILDKNSKSARGGKGKSAVFWKESYSVKRDNGDDDWQWNSDGIISLVFDKEYKELYVEFWISYGESFTTMNAGISKFFRIKHAGNKDNLYQNFLKGDNGPSIIWDYSANIYGVRNVLAFRGDPTVDENGNSPYYLDNETCPGVPSGLSYGDASLNFTSYLAGMAKDGGHPKLKDKLNGGYLPEDGVVTHEQVYGKSGEWTKVAFYVKMNSAPKVNDGVLIQWIDDVQILKLDKIAWHNYRPDGKIPTWNAIHFGGNDYFGKYQNSDKHEEFYSIDDIEVRTTIPANLR